jgi:hypothetical protein
LQRAKQWGWLGAVAAAVLLAVFAVARSQPKARPAADEVRLLTADAALGQAMRTGDRAAVRRFLSLQFTFIDGGGKIHQRRDVLADLKGMAATPAGDAKVRNYGLLSVVSGHRTEVTGREVFFVDIWVRQKRAWRALLMQDVVLAAAETPPAAPTSAAETHATPYECKNPCQAIPYRVRSAAEQDILNTYQAIVRAIAAHDPAEWEKRVADQFVLYGSGHAPVSKTARLDSIDREKEAGRAETIGEVGAMRLSVYGDAAAMIASEAAPGNAGAPYRATRVFVRSNGQWLMALSAHTDVE